MSPTCIGTRHVFAKYLTASTYTIQRVKFLSFWLNMYSIVQFTDRRIMVIYASVSVLSERLNSLFLIETSTEAEFLDEIKTQVLRVFFLAIQSHLCSLHWDFYFFKLTQPLTVSTGRKEENLIGKHTLSLWIRNPYRNLKPENSQYYAKKPSRNCTFMNSAYALLFSSAHSLSQV